MNELRPLRIIFAALLGSIGIYCFVAWMVAKRTDVAFDNRLKDPLVQVFYVLSATIFVIAFVVSTWLRGRGRPRRLVYIVRWALLESVAIYGLVAAFVRFDWRLIIPPAMLSILGFALSYPQEEA
jgi:F0F1-type ATP synthase membrane subunit c/vacuolar-type H+-ATPase subunit K